ncbi:low temperature requirement protein A [Cellulomonas fimi]|uniref:Low temperature requirement A n=1 Tax=Cellulomonas fimi (strain ATCC 484 / DSM 20113 / JCM 1341 / CCUG 24087 / LMG 16345 / NBRC 15513 / NCIMB 8980 / NCTC 7547 / NRS-133) TaxID=590998 RepID=F4H347_CELFA|nr:low temperature requirement protein A [Cellulomonas fimi]AEE47665.1 low temperature requirement A [Cellulomonas fimi ATCC 484]NNH07421.1 low temperature requirement protein A [Cellulomonas fimi]VEH36753.1 Predicted membrane protein [Cellulomonas fimi]
MTSTGRLGTGGGRIGMRADVLRHGDGHDGSRVGYVELFFDLVFVFAVTQLSHLLIAHPDGEHLVQTLILGWAVWWLWMDTTWVTNWLDPERLPVRAMLLVLMLLGLLMSSAIPEAFGDKALLFAVPYVVIQMGRTLFTAWAMGRHWPANALNFVRITVWLSVSSAFWVAGALLDEQRLLLWVVAALIDATGPRAMFWVPGMRGTHASTWEVRGDHMAERVALFMIISLGESIIVTGTAFGDLTVTPVTIVAFLAAFVSTVLMWLLFFDRSERRATEFFVSRDETGMVAQTAYTYVPFLLVMGIVATAVADELVLLHPEGHHGATDGWTAWLMCGAAAVYLLGNTLFRRATGGRWSAWHLGGGAAALALVLLAPVVTPLTLSWLTNTVLLTVILGDVAVARRATTATRAREGDRATA